MAPKLPDLDQWLDAVAPVVKLDVAAEQRAGVRDQLKTAAKLAALLEKVPLKDETAAAAVYRA
ncbi:MAG: DUF4089 domain-containing protein [Devosia sp.]